MSVKWIFGNEIDKKEIRKAEEFFKIKYPSEYVDAVTSNNGAAPEPICFDIPNVEKEKVFRCLISVLEDDPLGIYSSFSVLRDEYGINDLLPFGKDPFGNYLCFHIPDMKIYYLNCEQAYRYEDYFGKYVAGSFAEFLDMLYDPEG